MFVVSIKSAKLKKYLICFLAAALVVIGGTLSVSSNKTANVASMKNISLKAETSDERIAFFKQFGWTVKAEPLEVKEVVIPEEFDAAYNEYNLIQKEQNLDLEDYKGVRVKSWSYEITNYPDRENSDGAIRGNLLVYNGTVIGGDICSVELGGFMHGFSLPKEEETTVTQATVSQTQAS